MRLSIGLCSLMLALVLAVPAVAVRAETPTGAEAATGTNIFSVPETEAQTPAFTAGGGPSDGRAKLRRALLGDVGKGVPNFRQIQMLPTLTPQQRRQLREQNKEDKTKAASLVEQLKKLQQQRDTAGGAVSSEIRAQFTELRSQLQALRKKSWEQSKALLTDAQIRDLQAMKRGELQPSTFRGAGAGTSATTEMMTGQ